MRKDLLGKTLVMGIVVLFIGVSVSTAFAIKTGTSEDTTPPVIEVTWDTYKHETEWYLDFICKTFDNESGIDRLEWYINEALHGEISNPSQEHIFTMPWHEYIKLSTFTFIAYNGAGLSSYVVIDGSDIESVEDCDCQAEGEINLVKLKSDINRLKVYTGILSQSSKFNPMIQRRIERLSDLLFKIENDNTRFWNFPFICWVLLFPIFVVATILARMPNPITEMFYYMITSFGALFNCDWVPL